jgi:hypothetical protein
MGESDRSHATRRSADMNHITLIGDGQAWNATYTVEGGQVCVSSAYGGKRAKIGPGEDADAAAHRVLEAVIKGWSPATRRAAFKPSRPYAANARR